MQGRLDRLIDAIDRLVDEQLARGELGGDVDQDRCELCGGPWHGAPTYITDETDERHFHGCPGAFASDTQLQQWHRDRERARAAFRAGRCPLCHGRWHAFRGDRKTSIRSYRWHPECPGACANAMQLARWRLYPGPKSYLGWRLWRLGYLFSH